jgi:hypothetical protein
VKRRLLLPTLCDIVDQTPSARVITLLSLDWRKRLKAGKMISLTSVLFIMSKYGRKSDLSAIKKYIVSFP